MKKYLIVWILISSFLLWSCSIDWNDEKDKKISEFESQISEIKNKKQNDFFNKKQECLKLKNDIEKDTIEVWGIFYNVNEKSILEQIFYSPTKDVCFFILDETKWWLPATTWLFEYWKHYSTNSPSEFYCNFRDFQWKEINEWYGNSEKIGSECDKKMEIKVKELKWE